jgi:hypothetical protein
MSVVLGYVAGLGGLCALVWCAGRGIRWAVMGEAPPLLRPVVDRGQAWLASRRAAPEPIPPVLLALELDRLARHVRYVDQSDLPNKAERLMAARLAYDHALRDYCRAVDIPVPPAIRGLSREQRFHMESALIGAGHEW